MTEYGRIHTDGSRSGGQPVLKPCGHCGEQCADLIIDQGDKWAHYSASCLEVRTGYNLSDDAPWRAEAIAAYNTRKPTQGYGVVTAANYTSPIGGAATGLQTVVIREGMAACTDRIGGDCVVTHGVVGVAKDPAAEWQAGYEAGVEAAATALEADARLCDCAALEERECACGAWDDYKSITSARAVEIVRKLADTQ